jgi:hypothetical protein
MKVEPAKIVVLSGPSQADFNPSAMAYYQSERQLPTISIALLIASVLASMLFQWPAHFPGELESKVYHGDANSQQIALQNDHHHSHLLSNLDPYAPPTWAIPSTKNVNNGGQ